MANANITLTSLDFADYKASLKTFLQSQAQFKDYNFDGSNLSVILDLLTYNTYLNAFYLNMIGSEMFLDTAQLRDSVVLKAKELNYTPRSFRSAVANVNLQVILTGNNLPILLTIPKGTTFTGLAGSNSYTFSTDQNIVVQSPNGVFYANNLQIYEGTYITDTFVVQPIANSTTANTANSVYGTQRFTLSNPTIDTSSLTVTVVANNGANVVPYTLATSLLDLKTTSLVYFLQGAENGQYEVVFGDNVVGAAPPDYSTVIAEYRTCNGQLPNGLSVFLPNGGIGGSSNIVVTTVSGAVGGDIGEDIESIRKNAPLYYSTQDRAVTTTDYETLLQINYPEIEAISVYGGEDATPPQYGTVILSIKIANFDAVPDAKKIEYAQFLSGRAPLTIQPVFVEPDYVYISLSTTVKYNVNVTALNPADIAAFVTSTIQQYNEIYLDNFNATLLYSRLVADIDATDPSIISNQTDYRLMRKFVPSTVETQNYTINFNTALNSALPVQSSIHPATTEHTIESTTFIYNSLIVSLEDDGAGNIRMVQEQSDGNHHTLFNVGTVNYATGVIQLINFYTPEYFGDSIRFYARLPIGVLDYTSSRSSVLEIPNDEITVHVQIVRQ